MTYQRIEDASHLPPAGPPNARAREKQDLDFKGFADRAKSWEHAKDIAAFANALGGVLLIGADDNSGQLVYSGLKNQTVADVKSIYEDAAKSCSPTAVVDVVPIEQAPGVVVVAVNVDPHAEFVAAPAGSRDKNGNECVHGAAWGFPIRRASKTEWLDPDGAAMFMNRDIRRAVVLLSRVPPRSAVTVHYPHLRQINYAFETVMTAQKFTIEDVSFATNRVRLAAFNVQGNGRISVPLLDVLDAWESRDGEWAMRVAGEIHTQEGSQMGPLFEYRPIARRHI